MLNRSLSRPSSGPTADLPLFVPHQHHVSAVHSTVLTSRSPSTSPAGKSAPLALAPYCSLPPLEEKNASLLQSTKRTSGDEKLDTQRPSSISLDSGEERPSSWKVTGTILFYLVAAIVMVFVNKWVLRATSIPITFLLCQLLLATAFLQIGIITGSFDMPGLSLGTSKSLAPLILINVVGLVFNTYCLQYVDASFYQVARGLVLPFTVLTSYLFLNSRPSSNILGAVLIVCAGFFWGVQSEQLHASWIGVFLGVFSSITTSVHAIVVKRSLTVTSSPIELAYYNNLFSALLLVPVLPFTSEPAVLKDLFVTGGESLRTFVIGALVTGVFGFLICLAGFLSIKITSPVTHMVSSAVRGVLQTVLGIILFGDVVSMGRAIGIGFILAGSVAYTAIKGQEARGENAANKREARDVKSHSLYISIPSSANNSPIKCS